MSMGFPWRPLLVLLLFGRLVVSNSLQPYGLPYRLPCPSLSPRVCLKLMSIESVMPSNHLILCQSSPPALSLSQHQGLFHWVSCLHQVAKVLELQLQYQSFQWIFRVNFLWDWVVWSQSPSDSQESFRAPQFKSISSLAFSLLYGLTLTSLPDYWKSHNYDYGPLSAKWCVCFLIGCVGLS